MQKGLALIIAIALTFLLLFDYYFIFRNKDIYPRETVLVSRVIDGDTLKLYDNRSIRLVNINAPEKSEKNSNLSTNYLKKFENKTIDIEILGEDMYKRELVRIYSKVNKDYVNLNLVKLGLATKFLVQKSETIVFANAEKEAIEKSLGIWNKSDYYSCFNAKMNQQQEILVLTNICGNINVKSWVLKDESRKRYVFPNINFSIITIHSGIGKDNSTDLFWNSKTDIWNNDRDTVYLLDSNGKIVLYHPYGY